MDLFLVHSKDASNLLGNNTETDSYLNVRSSFFKVK